MWRRIGGIVLGWLSGGVLGFILFMVLYMILKKDGIVNEEGGMTAVASGVFLAMAVATSYLSGVIARLIGKDKKTIMIYLVVAGLFGLWGVLRPMILGTPEPPPMDERTPEWAKDLSTVGLAIQSAPIWFTIVNFLLTLGGIALGGLNKGDFDKAPATE